MTQASLLETFTPDQEINEWIVGDDSVEIRGYVDQIEGTRTVNSGSGAKKKPVSLFKVIVNNGSNCRVRVLFWGDLAIKYSSLIHDRTVITITRGRTSTTNSRYINPLDVVIPLVLYILPSTVIEIDKLKFQEEKSETEIPSVELKEVVNSSGLVWTQGYLKQPFIKVTAYGSSYGGGVLVEDKLKLQVKIAQFEELETLQKGCYLRVCGKYDAPLHGAPQFLVRSMDDITLIETVQKLSVKELRLLGYQTPKRKSDSSLEGTPKKLSPFDS